VAVSCVEVPEQIVASADTATEGDGLTVTVTESFAVQRPPGLAVTMYRVVLVGDANGLMAEALDKPAAGDQL